MIDHHLFVHYSLTKYARGLVQCVFDIKTDFTPVSDIIRWVYGFPVPGMRSIVAVSVTGNSEVCPCSLALYKNCPYERQPLKYISY